MAHLFQRMQNQRTLEWGTGVMIHEKKRGLVLLFFIPDSASTRIDCEDPNMTGDTYIAHGVA